MSPENSNNFRDSLYLLYRFSSFGVKSRGFYLNLRYNKQKQYTMFRIILSMVIGIVTMPLFAQINMQDSTATLIANWAKGDKLKYAAESYTYEIQDNDTICTKNCRELFTIEVTDSTADGYILEYLSFDSELYYRDSLSNELQNWIAKKTEGMPLILKTNEFGNILDIVNWNEIYNMRSQVLDSIKIFATEKLKKDTEGQSDEKIAQMQQVLANIFNGISNILLSKPLSINSIPLSRALAYHGRCYELYELYEDNTQMPSPFDQTPIDVKSEFWFKEYDVNSSWVKFAQELQYNSDQLFDSFMNMSKIQVPETEREHIFLYTYFSECVHTNSGWVDEVVFYTVSATSNKTKINGWDFELVTE